MLEERIKKQYPSLTDQQKKIAGHFLSLGHEAAFLTTAQLAQQLKASEATIVRFARALGYRGYPDLQKELQETIRKKLSPPKALHDSIVKKHGQDIYSRIFETDHQNLLRTREANSNQVIDQAVKEIIRARRVGVTGFRSSHAIAYLLYFLLGQVRKNCDLLEFRLGSLPNQIINYGARDLLICISLPRYSRQTLASLIYAQKNHCKTIAITDTPISPIGQNADLVLLVGNQSSTYFNSLTGAVSLVNCLVAGVSLKNKNSLETLKLVNEVVTEWGFLLM